MEGTLGEERTTLTPKVETHLEPALESGGVDDGSAARRIIKSTARGDVVMTLDASVNDFVALVPGLDDIVNAINDAVLANLRGAVETNLIAEYERWREERQGDDVNDDDNKENETFLLKSSNDTHTQSMYVAGRQRELPPKSPSKREETVRPWASSRAASLGFNSLCIIFVAKLHLCIDSSAI